VTARPRRKNVPSHPGVGNLLVQLADPLVQAGRVEARAGQKV
jgi:hypothetical protein